MKAIHKIAFILTIIGGLNWLLVGLGMWMGSNWNVVNKVLGSWSGVEALVYVLVGISAIVLVVGHKKACKDCQAAPVSSM